jgi:uncharacterized damage-inducible protein DinB
MPPDRASVIGRERIKGWLASQVDRPYRQEPEAVNQDDIRIIGDIAMHINHRVTLKVLEALPPQALKATLSVRGGRDIARQLAHVHEVRTAWLRKADNPGAVTHFKKDESPSKAQLVKALDESADAVERLIRRSCASDRQVGGFKRDVALLGYLIAHESHHRGSILLTAKQAGHPLSEELRRGIWS